VSGTTASEVAVGEIVGFGKVWNPFRKKAKVLVRVDGTVVAVFIDRRHLDFVRKKYRAGSPVAVGFYGGEWHIGIPPVPPGLYSAGQNIGELDTSKRGVTDFDLHESVERPETGENPRPHSPIQAVKIEKDESDGMLDDVSTYGDYISLVEADIKRSGDEILESLGLSHLGIGHGHPPNKHAAKKGHKPVVDSEGQLALIIAQNKEILDNQKEVLRLQREFITNDRTGRSKDN
jgi:hypothetical protein